MTVRHANLSAYVANVMTLLFTNINLNKSLLNQDAALQMIKK